jgi:uncharacterized membrane protein YuzA (DUF378 family)
MNLKQEKDDFRYTYSAKQQEEIKNIRKKYLLQEEDKMEQLRRLDAGVTSKATMKALVLGVIGALVLGLGMSLIMSELGAVLGMSDMASLVMGIVIGLCGMVPVALAYPVYNQVVKKEREKIAPEILRLTEELLK